MINPETVDALLEKYRAKGAWSGTELLLTPLDATEFSRDAEALGIPVTGVDVWVEPQGGGTVLSHDSGSGRYVPSEILAASFALQASHAIVRDYLSKWLPSNAIRVHIGLQIA